MDYLFNSNLEQETPPLQPGPVVNSEGPGTELNDIAATAQALQPTGYTLETTQVCNCCHL